jgi:hypothetical protein
MYSIDYKQRAVAFKDEGHTLKELKEAFKHIFRKVRRAA